MSEEDMVDEQTLDAQEEADLDTASDESSKQEVGESVEEYKARLAKAQELANNYKIRAEKAEKMAKAPKPSDPQGQTQTAGDLSTKDLYALFEAKVPQEDVDAVKEYATFKKISVAEALQSNVVKTILSERNEQRITASAANVGGSKRSSGKIPDDVLLSKASNGELPESDADLERLIRLRKGYKN